MKRCLHLNCEIDVYFETVNQIVVSDGTAEVVGSSVDMPLETKIAVMCNDCDFMRSYYTRSADCPIWLREYVFTAPQDEMRR